MTNNAASHFVIRHSSFVIPPPAHFLQSLRPTMPVRLLALLLLAATVHAAPPGALVKHTVSGSGTVEQGRGLRAAVDRATFHPIDHYFALSVSGHMGWVITGTWAWQGRDVALSVNNMNNTPARGSGSVELDSRGSVESLKLSGSARGGSYKVRFKSGAPARAEKKLATVRLGPQSARPAPTPAPRAETFDRSRRGKGTYALAGAGPLRLLAADVQLSASGRVSVRLQSERETLRYEGTFGSNGGRPPYDLVLHTVAGGSGIVTGSARMDRGGKAVETLDLQGLRDGRPFRAQFRAR
jgi:hypothetical protein